MREIVEQALKNGISYEIEFEDEYEEGELNGNQLRVDWKNKCLLHDYINFYFKDYGITWKIRKGEE